MQFATDVQYEKQQHIKHTICKVDIVSHHCQKYSLVVLLIFKVSDFTDILHSKVTCFMARFFFIPNK